MPLAVEKPIPDGSITIIFMDDNDDPVTHEFKDMKHYNYSDPWLTVSLLDRKRIEYNCDIIRRIEVLLNSDDYSIAMQMYQQTHGPHTWEYSPPNLFGQRYRMCIDCDLFEQVGPGEM